MYDMVSHQNTDIQAVLCDHAYEYLWIWITCSIIYNEVPYRWFFETRPKMVAAKPTSLCKKRLPSASDQ